MNRVRATENDAPTALRILLRAIAVTSMPGVGFAGNSPHTRTKATIQNPLGLSLPGQRVQIVHSIVCRVVAKEFHVDEQKVGCALNLVLGEQKERSTADEANGVYTIYLEHWDEPTFAISDMRLSVQRMVSRARWQRMEREIVRSVDQVAPLDATQRSIQKSQPVDNAFRP